MSTKSIKLFQNAYPRHKPSPAVELRNEASKLRAQAQHIHAKLHAQANKLEDIASELEPERPRLSNGHKQGCAFVTMRNRDCDCEPRCHCGTPLRFEEQHAEGNAIAFTCWCELCKGRAERDGHTIFVYGHGKDRASAFSDWQEAVNRF